MRLADAVRAIRYRHEKVPPKLGHQLGLQTKGDGWNPPNRMTKQAHRRDVPKRDRWRLIPPPRPMVDPMATLGHEARPRKRAA